MNAKNELQDLLTHADWLRRLAAHLVGEGEAADVVQETWAAAVRKAPEGEARPWLAKVVRNVARRRWWVTTSSRARESAAVALGEPFADSPEELLARAHLQRTLADCVLGLEEPFRSVILLRYYEGKTAAAIARAQGVPAGTVRWRLKEALDRLRARLDREHGGGERRWRALLLPLATLPPPLGVGWMMAMSSKSKVIAAALLLVLATGLVLLVGPSLLGERPRGAARLDRPAVAPPARLFLRKDDASAGAAGIDGRVEDSEGHPIGGALVALSPARRTGDIGRGPAAIATSDEAGRFAFEQPGPGPFQVTATKRGWRATATRPIFVRVGDREAVVLKLAQGGATLTGRILDEGGGAIPGAVVSVGPGYPWDVAYGPARPKRQFVAVADQDGQYQLNLEPREYALHVEAAGYVPVDTTIAVTKQVARDVRLAPAARLEGRVIERGSGAPVPEAEVKLTADFRAFETFRQVLTDSEGRFVIDDAAAGQFQLSAGHRERGLFGAGIKVVTVSTQARFDLVVEVEPGVSLSGHVRDPRRVGLSGVGLEVVSLDVGVLERRHIISGADGAFALHLSAPGRYRITPDGGATTGPDSSTTAIVGPKGHAGVEIVIEPGDCGPSLTGRIRSHDGRPVAGALVRAEPPGPSRGRLLGQAESDEKGQFRFEGTAAQPMTITAWHPKEGYRELELQPPLPTTPIDLTLGAGALIGGIVTFEDGGPAAGVSVAVTRQEGTVVYDSDTTGTDGRFVIRSLAPGRYTVRALRKQGPHNIWTAREQPGLKIVELAPEQKKEDVALVVGRGGKTITGTVHLPGGAPAAGARILANREEDGRSWKPSANYRVHEATADEDGRWRLDDVEDHTFALWGSLPGLPEAEARGIKAGTEGVRLNFVSPARISGVVVTSAGRPVPVFLIAATPTRQVTETPAERERRTEASQRPAERVQDASGAFALEGLLAGTYEIKVTSGEGGLGGREVITLAAGEQRAGLRLVASPGVRARGRIVELDSGKPVANMLLTTRAGGRYLETRSAADGSFAFEGVVAGEEIQVETRLGERNELVGEYLEASVPRGGGELDLGTLRLMAGDAKAAAHAGTLGVRIRANAGRPFVSSAAPEGPAAGSGLRQGDLLLEINGRSIEGLGLGAISHLMKAPVGTKVALRVQTPPAEPRVVVITSAKP